MRRQSPVRPRIGIISGDPAGIGPEVALKSLATPEVHDLCQPLLIGDYDLLDQTAQRVTPELQLVPGKDRLGEGASTPHVVRVYDVAAPQQPIDIGVVSKAAGEMSLRSIRAAFDLALRGDLDGLVMAPINKESLSMTEAGYHSEFDLFAELAGVTTVTCVVKWSSIFRATVTGHMPFREIVEHLSTPGIVQTAQLLRETMCRCGVEQPCLAVAALNPHGGEGGLFGQEEQTVIAPAVRALAESGLSVAGPIPADTVFVRAIKGEFDGIVFLYHDQGNIAMNARHRGEGHRRSREYDRGDQDGCVTGKGKESIPLPVVALTRIVAHWPVTLHVMEEAVKMYKQGGHRLFEKDTPCASIAYDSTTGIPPTLN